MYYYIHTPVLQELVRALPHVFWVCHAVGDDVDHAENATLLGCVAMIVIVVVMIMRV